MKLYLILTAILSVIMITFPFSAKLYITRNSAESSEFKKSTAEEYNETSSSEVIITAEDFKKYFTEKTDLSFDDDDLTQWARVKEKDENGYIKILEVCGKDFTSEEIKEILNLSSASFKAKADGDCFILTLDIELV